MLFKSYKVLKSGRQSQDYSLAKVRHLQRGEPLCKICDSKRLIHYDSFSRKIKHISKNGAIYHLKVIAKRYKCLDCGKVFRESLTNVKGAYRSSEDFKDKIISEYKKGVSNKNISAQYCISPSSVERIIHEKYNLKIKEALSYEAPSIIGIDEHTIHKGYKFATTICDLKNRRIYDVIKGRKKADIEKTLLAYKGRKNVKVVCMDLSSGYKSIARRCFPNAKIVADRFHVIRLVLYHYMEFCKQVQPEIKWKRGITYLLRTHRKNIKENRTQKLKILDKFLEDNPAIKHAYLFKEELCQLLNKKTQTLKECRNNINMLKEMMKIMKYKSALQFESLAQTMSQWWTPIIRMWRFTKNNSITEGFHRKMKLIQRRAYGYKNFNNYRLRVLVECGNFK